eukprot:2485233-Karenia_brevis.AAC.1
MDKNNMQSQNSKNVPLFGAGHASPVFSFNVKDFVRQELRKKDFDSQELVAVRLIDFNSQELANSVFPQQYYKIKEGGGTHPGGSSGATAPPAQRSPRSAGHLEATAAPGVWPHMNKRTAHHLAPVPGPGSSPAFGALGGEDLAPAPGPASSPVLWAL